jgi:hypothetical protein
MVTQRFKQELELADALGVSGSMLRTKSPLRRHAAPSLMTRRARACDLSKQASRRHLVDPSVQKQQQLFCGSEPLAGPDFRLEQCALAMGH